MAANDNADKMRTLCDEIVGRAATIMQESGAPLEMILDRFTTYAAAQTVASFGKPEAIHMLRHAADQVEGGLLDHLEPTKN